MRVLTGRFKGTEVTVRQYANDWINGDTVGPAPRPVVVSPRQVVLTAAEVEWFRARTDQNRVGQFWVWWRLNDDGTFTSLRPRPARQR